MPNPRLRVVTYVRDLSLTGPDKFREFDKLARESKDAGADAILVACPNVLGDNYEELVQNLTKLAQGDLALIIVPPTELEKNAAERN